MVLLDRRRLRNKTSNATSGHFHHQHYHGQGQQKQNRHQAACKNVATLSGGYRCTTAIHPSSSTTVVPIHSPADHNAAANKSYSNQASGFTSSDGETSSNTTDRDDQCLNLDNPTDITLFSSIQPQSTANNDGDDDASTNNNCYVVIRRHKSNLPNHQLVQKHRQTHSCNNNNGKQHSSRPAASSSRGRRRMVVVGAGGGGGRLTAGTETLSSRRRSSNSSSPRHNNGAIAVTTIFNNSHKINGDPFYEGQCCSTTIKPTTNRHPLLPLSSGTLAADHHKKQTNDKNNVHQSLPSAVDLPFELSQHSKSNVNNISTTIAIQKQQKRHKYNLPTQLSTNNNINNNNNNIAITCKNISSSTKNNKISESSSAFLSCPYPTIDGPSLQHQHQACLSSSSSIHSLKQQKQIQCFQAQSTMLTTSPPTQLLGASTTKIAHPNNKRKNSSNQDTDKQQKPNEVAVAVVGSGVLASVSMDNNNITNDTSPGNWTWAAGYNYIGPRKWELHPGRNLFLCNGRAVMSYRYSIFLLTNALIILTTALFAVYDLPYLSHRLSSAIPALFAFLFTLVMATLLRAALSDPGILPRASTDEANELERDRSTAHPATPRALGTVPPFVTTPTTITPVRNKGPNHGTLPMASATSCNQGQQTATTSSQSHLSLPSPGIVCPLPLAIVGRSVGAGGRYSSDGGTTVSSVGGGSLLTGVSTTTNLNNTNTTSNNPFSVAIASADSWHRHRRRAAAVQMVYVRGRPIRLKYCFTCQQFRPPRASHCSVCDNCVLNFDHHCPWIGNCVGLRNYRFFYFFIVLLSALDCLMGVAVFVHLYMVCMDHDGSMMETIKETPASLLIACVNVVSIWSIVGLSGFHTYLLAINQTTNEDIKGTFSSGPSATALVGLNHATSDTDNNRDQPTTTLNSNNKNSSGQSASVHSDDDPNPYSHRSCYKNIMSVLCAPEWPSLLDAHSAAPPDNRAIWVDVDTLERWRWWRQKHEQHQQTQQETQTRNIATPNDGHNCCRRQRRCEADSNGACLCPHPLDPGVLSPDTGSGASQTGPSGQVGNDTQFNNSSHKKTDGITKRRKRRKKLHDEYAGENPCRQRLPSSNIGTAEPQKNMPESPHPPTTMETSTESTAASAPTTPSLESVLAESTTCNSTAGGWKKGTGIRRVPTGFVGAGGIGVYGFASRGTRTNRRLPPLPSSTHRRE